MCFGGSGGGDGGAAQARADEMARQARIKEGVARIDQEFSKFNDDFYNQRRNAYTAFAMPQVGEQYKQNKDQLAYSLARSGLGQSSEAARQASVLQRDNAMARQQVAEGATSEAQKARQAVEDQRYNLVGQLQSTSDPTMAANNALRQAGVLSMQTGFNPVANLFQNTTGMLAAANQAGAYSGGPGMGAYKEYFGFGKPNSSGNRTVGR
jgi:hypothetical protein